MAQFPSPTSAYGVWSLNEIRNARRGDNWPQVFILDPFFNQTTLLLHGGGTNGGQNNTFLDSSTNNFTITRTGNTTQGSFSPFGDRWSNFFDGSGDYLKSEQNAAFAFGSGDFTLEAWVYPTGSPRPATGVVSTRINATGATNQVFFGVDNTSVLYYSGTAVSGGVVQFNAWSHIACTRSGSTVRIFLNGTQVGSVEDSVSKTTEFGFVGAGGGDGDLNQLFGGYIADARIIKGTALYTSAFTPPTEPLTAISGTSLLTCQSNGFKDNSANNFAITPNGDVKVTKFSPYAPTAVYSTAVDGGSGYFDGTGDYLAQASDAAFGYGTGDFTIEFWLYLNSTSAQNIASNLSSASSTNPHIYISSTIRYFTAGADRITGAALSTGQWYHIAVCRSSGSTRLFVDGTQSGSTYSDANNYGTAAPFGIGTFWSGGSPVTSNTLNGYISNVRVIKGTALYTSAFTPPAAPLTAVTNTSLLCNFTNAAIFDSTAKNVLETVGNAQVDTTTVKYGTGSMEFDANGDYLITPNKPELILAGVPWTIECWVYPTTDYSTWRIIFTKRATSSASTSYQGYLRLSTGVIGFYNSVGLKDSSTVLDSNQWSHCAWVYDGTNINIYVNGTSVLSEAISVTEVDEPLVIGGGRGLNEWFGGYLNDFRITKGVARYTANFTPPSKTFPDR